MFPYSLKKNWVFIKKNAEIADIGFLFLRVLVLATIYAWLSHSNMPAVQIRMFYSLFLYFIAYCFVIYMVLFFFFGKKRNIYVLSLFFDLSFVYLLIKYSGGFASNFFIGFYFLTAMHSFYYGYLFGLGVAVVSTLLYLMSGNIDFTGLHWTDFFLRTGFLFLIALPLGLLSEQLRKDKQEIETLNCELLKSIRESERLQKKLIEHEKLSALGRITADVAHEIRNPLTAIGGFAKRLEKRIHDETKEKEYIQLITSEVARLERILKDVLSFSREAKYHLSYCNINSVVAESLIPFADVCQEQSIEIKEELDTKLPEGLLDKDQIRQAINNLLTNAIDAMPNGGTLTLRTGTETLNDINYLEIDIIDNGIGVPDEMKDRLFEPFYSTKEIGHGTGLGLSISKKIMDEHKGRIKVFSEIGNGSTFSLLFPYVTEEETFKTQCWEFTKCGVESSLENKCPAYPNHGRICWGVAGTFCDGKVQGAIAQKIGDCRKCEFYQRVVILKDM